MSDEGGSEAPAEAPPSAEENPQTPAPDGSEAPQNQGISHPPSSHILKIYFPFLDLLIQYVFF